MEMEILDFFVNNFDTAEFQEKENRYLFKNGLYLNLEYPIYTEYHFKKRDDNLKRCTKCEQLKTTQLFFKRYKNKQDTDHWCIDCKSIYLKEYRKTENGKLIYLKSILKTPFYKEKQRIRAAAKAVKIKIKSPLKTCDILGCDYGFAFKYLKLSKNMDSEIDHIIPLSWAKTEDELINLGHYSNLQMLDKTSNISKGNRYCLKQNLENVLNLHPNKEIILEIINRNKKRVLNKKPLRGVPIL